MLLFVIVHTFYIKNLPLKIIIPNAIKRGNVFLILIPVRHIDGKL